MRQRPGILAFLISFRCRKRRCALILRFRSAWQIGNRIAHNDCRCAFTPESEVRRGSVWHRLRDRKLRTSLTGLHIGSTQITSDGLQHLLSKPDLSQPPKLTPSTPAGSARFKSSHLCRSDGCELPTWLDSPKSTAIGVPPSGDGSYVRRRTVISRAILTRHALTLDHRFLASSP